MLAVCSAKYARGMATWLPARECWCTTDAKSPLPQRKPAGGPAARPHLVQRVRGDEGDLPNWAAARPYQALAVHV